MTENQIAVIVLAAGMGTRMKSCLPKVMHLIAGQPMVNHLLDKVTSLSPSRTVVVVGPDMDKVAAAVAPHPTVVQADRLGTGHAVAQARDALEGFAGTVLILYGDTPLITRHTLETMLARRREADDPAVVVLGFRPVDPGQYGRLVTGAAGLEAIVEYKDATAEEQAIALCNSGVMAVDGRRLFDWTGRLRNDNAKGEYYLTDIVALARAEGLVAAVVEGDEQELLGVNSRVELAAAERIAQDELRRRAMEGGATLRDPASVTFSWDTVIGRDVVIGPNVVFGPAVTVEDEVEIRAFCHIEGARVGRGAIVGPFARLRPGAVVGETAHIGNFVEIKNASVETGAKVNHLTYIGDARVGAGANIGAGTITCNYDGFNKSFTDIGAGAFIGSNSSLVAPVVIGDGAIVGAGSVVTRNVEADALALTRAAQSEHPGWAARFRERMRARRAARKKD